MAFPANTTRYLLFLCNLIFLVSALAVATAAVLIGLSFYQHDMFLEKNLMSPPIIVVIVCGIICLISFFGCCGVIRENRCCLYMFSIFMIIVIIMEVVAGVYVFSTKDEIAVTIQHKMQDLMKQYNQTKNTAATQSWDVLQHDFHCCGVKNSSDWLTFFPKGPLPHSCCADLPLEKTCNLEETKRVPGCFSRFSHYIQTTTLTLAIIILSVGIVQLLCAITSGLLARYFKQRYEAV